MTCHRVPEGEGRRRICVLESYVSIAALQIMCYFFNTQDKVMS